MIVGVAAEVAAGERLVAMVPPVVPALREAGLDVLVQEGAGERAGFRDEAYAEQGADIVPDRDRVYSDAEIILRVRGFSPGADGSGDLDRLSPEQIVVGLLDPLGSPDVARRLAATGATSFALELLPRISRAQAMDALSSMATVAGYKAALMASDMVDKMYPMMITAAGTVTPAKIFVVGAGVAGLQAIATSRRLGGVVHAYDIRTAVKEQVESLGARFVELELETGDAEAEGGYAKEMDEEFYRRQRQMMADVVAASDAVITTAAVPGRRSPVLVTAEMIRGMKPGSVIVDLAAEGGGNCELTRAGETVEAHGVRIIGPVNLPATIPYDASQMYARNVASFLRSVVKEGELALDAEDPVHRESLLTRDGEVVNDRVLELLEDAGGADRIETGGDADGRSRGGDRDTEEEKGRAEGGGDRDTDGGNG